MRGQKSSHRETLRPATGPRASGSASPCPVVVSDDLEHLPVTADELNAIEAFLMPEIMRRS